MSEPRDATSFSGTRIAAGYFLVQGLVIPLWWGLLGTFPEARRFFLPDGASEMDLLAAFCRQSARSM